MAVNTWAMAATGEPVAATATPAELRRHLADEAGVRTVEAWEVSG
ncbi:hypothetical protein HEP87_01990 [Streptomyces sp. S1D4-11]